MRPLKFNMREALDFLKILWGRYAELEHKPAFEILMRSPEGEVRVLWADSPEDAVSKVHKLWHILKLWEWDIWVGVLPRKEKKEKGRGSEKDVIAGAFLWVDLDFKEVVDSIDGHIASVVNERGYYEYEDMIVYKKGNKYVIVNKPDPMNIKARVCMRLREIFDDDTPYTMIIDSGYGYHVYIALSDVLIGDDLKRLKAIEGKILGLLGADPHVKDLARVMRLPGTYNNAVRGRPVEVKIVDITGFMANLETLESKLTKQVGKGREETEEVKTPHVEGFRELYDHDILRISEMLSEGYVSGHRQNICLYLSGWGAWARISPLSIAKIIKILHEKNEDDDPLKMRLAPVVYSYKKLGLWGGNVESKFMELLNTWNIDKVPGESYRPSDGEEVKGSGGLEEELSSVLGEERALDIIREIEEIFKRASPFRDSIISLLDMDKQLYAVANLRSLMVYRAKRVQDENDKYRLKYKERVAIGAPTSVTIYINPLGGLTQYEVVWEAKTRPRPLVIGPAPIEDIISRLKAEGLVTANRLVHDVIPAIIEGYIRKGRAEVKEEIESPGFYYVNGSLISVRYNVEEVNKEKLIEALQLLNELAENWFAHARDRFATVVKWAAIAPFIYAMKQKNRWVPWIYLYGSSYTGKTTLGEIALSIWGLDSRFRKSGSSIDTIARLGHVISSSTFPILINEPGNAIYKEDIIETLKSAIESTLARGKYIRGTYTEIPSLAPLIMASNRVLPMDDALLRRLIVIRFTYGERIDANKAKEFDSVVKPNLYKLAEIGKLIAKVVIENPEVLTSFDWKELGYRLMAYCYAYADMEIPKWLEEIYEPDENPYEDMKESIRNYLLKRINEEYNRFVGRVEVTEDENWKISLRRTETAFEDRVRLVIEQRLLPWAILKIKEKDAYVYFTTELVRELRHVIGDIGGLKSIAELLGWEYRQSVKVSGRVIQAMIVNLRELVWFLSSHPEEDEVEGGSVSS